MITPPYLKPGDTVGIVAPASKVAMARIEKGLDKLRGWGLNVVLSRHLLDELNQFAGSDDERAADFQAMLDDDKINAIICARGGYGTNRVIDKLDFTKFRSHPKWIVGFSDITVLHCHLHAALGIESLHAAMPYTFPKDGSDNEATESLRKSLFGLDIQYKLPPDPMDRRGNAAGILTGGNLSLICAVNGSVSDIKTDGKILFLEDCEEYLYNIDRMMIILKRSGKLDKLAGLIVGRFTDLMDNEIPFGKTAEEIIEEAIKDYDYPVCYSFPSGHIDENRSLILGREVHLDVLEQGVELTFGPYPRNETFY